MIDIHSHILPGIDDGALNLDTSLAMAKIAVKDGICAMFATPHIQWGQEISPEQIKKQTAELNSILVDHKIPLTIYAGAEVPMGPEICSWRSHWLHNGPYILVEFPHSHIPTHARDYLYALQCEGLIPIIAHPERNGAVMQSPDLLVELVSTGCLTQITAESVTGEMGTQVQHCCHYLLREKVVHFLATDCHSTGFRKPLLKKAHKIVGRIVGKKQADSLVSKHPEAVINGTSFM